MKLLPDQQRREIREFWKSGSSPGLEFTMISPSIAHAPWGNYIDLWTEFKYDVNYKYDAHPDVSFYFSPILQLKYDGGVSLELDIEKDFAKFSLSPAAARDAVAHGYIGRSNRIFPAYRTVPRLWAARLDALRLQNEAFNKFKDIADIGVAFVLTVPAMPAGAIEESVVLNAKVNRRRVPGTVRPGPVLAAQPPQNIAVTDQTIRDAMNGAPLKTQQKGGISIPLVQEDVNLLLRGKEPPAIKVDNGIIVDGNHRYVAGRIVGKDPPIQPWQGGRPDKVIEWKDMPISKERW